MGFKDGTANLKAEETDRLRESLWAQPGDGPSWMDGGSYLVTRRIRMLHRDLGPHLARPSRSRSSGGPRAAARAFGRPGEFDEPDFTATGPNGEPLIDPDAHVRLAHPDFNDGARLLRRGYNFTDGSDGLGRLDAGLFFMAYQRDPRTQFVAGAAPARLEGPAQRVHPAHVERAVRVPARGTRTRTTTGVARSSPELGNSR